MLKRDTRAHFAQSGIWSKKYRLWTPGNHPLGRTLSVSEYAALLVEQMKIPVAVTEADTRRRRWWMFQNGFFWEDEGLSPAGVEALLLERERRQRRRVERAMAAAYQQKQQGVQLNERRPIPDDVKMFVWQRDKGRCVKCGSQQNLEFDHIIPVAMGGSNTARNIQLLCETCNRSKGASLG